MTDTYAPFPETELQDLASFHDSVAKHHPERSYLQHVHEQRAKVCRDAVKSHEALRERCLLSELNLGSAEALLAAHDIPFQRANVETNHAA